MSRRSSSSSSSSSSSRSRSRSRDRQRQNNRHRRRSSRSRSSHRSSRRRSSSSRSRSRSRDKHNKNNDRRRSDNDRSTSSKSDSYGSSLGGGQHHSLPPPPPSFSGVGGVIPPPPMGSVPPPMGAVVPPPLGSVPPPPFGVIPPPPMAAHLPPPPPAMAASAAKPPTIPPPSSFSSGNKLGNPSPAAAAKKPAAANALKMNLGKVNTAAKSKLATVFNADSSDEEEEMPEEARYKTIFVRHPARQLVTSLAPANICYINVGGCPIVSAHFRRYRHDGASSSRSFYNSNFYACLLKKSNVILLKIFVKLHIFCVSWSVLLLQNTYAQRRSGHHNLERTQLLWQDPAGLHRHGPPVRAQAVAGYGPGLQRQHRSGQRPAEKVTSFLRRRPKRLNIITIIESSEEFDNVILENGCKSNYRRCLRLLNPFSAVHYLCFISPNSELLKQNKNDICKNINFNLLLFCIKIVIFNYLNR